MGMKSPALSEEQRRVLEHSGVRLLPEIVWWGDGPRPEVFVEPEMPDVHIER